MRPLTLSLLILVLLVPATAHASFTGTDLILPAVGRVDGIGGSRFFTTVWVTNPGPQSATYEMKFIAAGQSAEAATGVTESLAAGSTRTYENIAETVFGARGLLGAVRIRGDQPLLVSARIYNQYEGTAERDSAGQFMSAVPASFGVERGERAHLQGARSTSDYRYNVFFAETGGGATTSRITVVDSSGATIQTSILTLLPYEQRIVALSALIGARELTDGTLLIEALDGPGRLYAVGSLVSNGSQDGSLFEMRFPDRVLGSAGPAGPAGPEGPAGPIGPAGPRGAQGPAGATGATGAAGATGAPGATGAQGPPGATGAAGATGAQGPAGATGPQGSPGAQGLPGPQGVPGTQGASGATGATGATGPKGLQWRDAWNSATVYATDDAVSHNGSSFISLIDGNQNVQPGTNPAAWSLLAESASLIGEAAGGDLSGSFPNPTIASTAGANIVTAVNASASTILDGRLSSNVALKSAANVWTGATNTFQNGLAANASRITNVGTPTAASDAATKAYVDNAVGDGWSTAGNTVAAGDVLGSVNAQSVVFVTSNQQRMRITTDGQVVVNSTAIPPVGSPFTSFADGGAAIEGVATDFAHGVRGTATGQGNGVFGGHTNGTAILGVASNSIGLNSIGVEGRNTAMGRAGAFNIQNTANDSAALTAFTNSASLGKAADFLVISPTNNAAALAATHQGAGIAAVLNNSGTGAAVSMAVTNPANSSTALTGVSQGTGSAAEFRTALTTNASSTLRVTQSGTGQAAAFTTQNAVAAAPTLSVFQSSTSTDLNAMAVRAFSSSLFGGRFESTLPSNNARALVGLYNGGSTNFNGVGVHGRAVAAPGFGIGVLGEGDSFGVFAQGNLGATGAKTFLIDHPLDPENRYLRHYSMESPEVLNVYRGNVVLDAYGEGVVTLPDYFGALNINVTYQLTAIGAAAPELHVQSEVDATGQFRVAGGRAGMKVSWVVYAERNDPIMRQPGMRDVEIEKRGEARGKYLVPSLYGASEDARIFGEPKE